MCKSQHSWDAIVHLFPADLFSPDNVDTFANVSEKMETGNKSGCYLHKDGTQPVNNFT